MILTETPPVGALIYVEKEKRPYRVQARSDRFAVCSKPHFKTVLYCILDIQKQMRGPENLIFGFGAETTQQCEEMITRLEEGITDLSRRRSIPLDVTHIKLPKQK
jgi:hypothetical protein